MAIVGLDKTIDASDRPMGGFLIALGLFGLLCMIKCHERIRCYQERSKVFAAQLDALLDGSPLKKADAAPAHRNWFLKAYCRFYLWLHWVLMFAAVIALGFYVLHASSPHAAEPTTKVEPTGQHQ
jgi:hypothetical protein